ncbi:SCO6880 family protein [Frankia nepalensis]|uniref:SCO6880 family protein n=1 Tax=Frankia nepalensis TaxID=1836974 RepID=UPI003969F487
MRTHLATPQPLPATTPRQRPETTTDATRRQIRTDGLGAGDEPRAHARSNGTTATARTLTRPTATPAHNGVDIHVSGATSQTGDAATLASYRALLADTLLQHHDLRLWLTVDPRRAHHRRASPDRPEQVALDTARQLATRAATAGLTVHGALTTAQLTAELTAHADPTTATAPPANRTAPTDAARPVEPRGLAARANLPGARHAPATPTPPPLDPTPTRTTVEAYWDAARIGATWHRVFWVAAWPTGPLRPGWLDPLLHETPAARTLTVALQPIPPRTSRRRLNQDTAAVELALQIRDRHRVRIPTHLSAAHDALDQRDAELSAGHPELAYTALIDLAAPDRPALDTATAELADLAARAGITDLRPLHGRHHHVFPATLPLGLTIRRPNPGAH